MKKNILKIILFCLTAVFSATVASADVVELENGSIIFGTIERFDAGLVLAVIAWLLASIVHKIVDKALSKTTLDEKLSEHAGMAPVSGGLSQVLFWLIILLFVPAIMGALQMDGLLDPFREMISKVLDFLPNIVAAAVIGFVGWILATVLRNLTTNLLRTAGIDKIGQNVGLSESMRLSSVLGLLVFVAVFLPALVATLDALKIEVISKPATDMLSMFFESVPHIIAAGLILVITWLVASFASRLLASLLNSLGFNNLPQRAMGIADDIVNLAFGLTLGAIAVAVALSFGLGGREAAGKLTQHWLSKFHSGQSHYLKMSMWVPRTHEVSYTAATVKKSVLGVFK
ncbi:MAG: mechanosensitive ion channel [Smithellaceae bacterium]|jgi:hypothetical protein